MNKSKNSIISLMIVFPARIKKFSLRVVVANEIKNPTHNKEKDYKQKQKDYNLTYFHNRCQI